MKLLLTGATGFIGKHLTEYLIQTEHEIFAISRHPQPSPHPKIKWLHNNSSLAHYQFDAVIHLATAYAYDKKTSLSEIEVSNVQLPLNILTTTAKNGCLLFINTDTFFSKQEFNYSVQREYILSKRHFLDYGKLITERDDKFTFVNLRLEHVYGKNDNEKKFIPWLIDGLKKNLTHLELTPCQQKRDFIYVTDVVSAYSTLLDNAEKLNGFIEAGVGRGQSISLESFIRTAKEIIGSKSCLDFGKLSYRDNEIMDSFADTQFLYNLGWQANINFRDGIRLICENG